MRLLGIGAHPDDAEIFFFGLMSVAKMRGDAIHWIIASDGAGGGSGDRAALCATRKAEARAAASLAGVDPGFLDHADGGLASDGTLTADLSREIDAFGPDLVVTHAPNDYHPDHRAVSVAVRDAARFKAPVLYADTLVGIGFEPTHYVDISVGFAAKSAAILKHASQRPERFAAMAETWNRFRALQCNAPAERYAEAYRFEPGYPFTDIRGLLPPAPAVRPLGIAGAPPERPSMQ